MKMYTLLSLLLLLTSMILANKFGTELLASTLIAILVSLILKSFFKVNITSNEIRYRGKFAPRFFGAAIKTFIVVFTSVSAPTLAERLTEVSGLTSYAAILIIFMIYLLF